MALRNYTEFAEEPLTFPYDDTVSYTLPPLGIEAGITLAAVTSGKDKAFAKREGVELWKLVLGPLWDQMVADGRPIDFATRCGLTALADYQYGREAAEAAWEAGADPNLLAAYVNQKAAEQGNRAQRRSRSTAGVNKTPSRASTKATTSRKR